MANPRPAPASSSSARGLRLLDLVGFVAGFGLASLLARTIWPRFIDLTGPPLIAFALEFLWLGLAMSGPIILGLDPRRASALPPSRPTRPGQPISVVVVPPDPRPAPRPAPGGGQVEYTRAELAWLAIGGYWIALTFFVVPARATDAPWTLAGLVPVVGALALLMFFPRRGARGDSPAGPGWTHHLAVGLLWTWPVAWGLLVLLGRTI